MAYIGLKHPVFAPIATEPAGALPTYGTGLVIGMAMSANVTLMRSDSKLSADDRVAEYDNSLISANIVLGIDDLSDDAQKEFLGEQEASLNGEATIRAGGNFEAPTGGFGYYRVRKKNGIRTIRAYWYHKTKWGMPSEEATTKPDGSVEWQTPTVEGLAMLSNDETAALRDWKTFSSEADAIAWLNGLANIPVEASTGLSGLSLTGTGGALSPAFGSAIRYYTFGGVTGASVNVTATAADHTLKLYADGVFVENLTSGSASSSIPLDVGTKKLTIVVQETGKTSQITEIIVVKTA
jgi:phi13 family phage major tail protein